MTKRKQIYPRLIRENIPKKVNNYQFSVLHRTLDLQVLDLREYMEITEVRWRK